jgi:Gram-negative bacterial TonB protein C-terminal
MFIARRHLVLLLGFAASAQAQDRAQILGDSGSVTVWLAQDSIWTYVEGPRGNAGVELDTASLARWADGAARGASGGMYLSVKDGRISLDSAAATRVHLSDDSAQAMLAAMHRRFPPAPPANPTVYYMFQVERQAVPLSDEMQPGYPDQLRPGQVEGRVLAQFVVDSTGRVDLRTYKALISPQPLFTLALAAALPEMRFRPAAIKGRPVAELEQIPFFFGPRAVEISVGGTKGRAAVSFHRDSALLILTTDHGTFAMRADSFTMAAWADSAAAVRAPSPHGKKKLDFTDVRISYFDSALHATVAMGFLRLSSDSMSAYECSAHNGAWGGGFVLPPDSARRLFVAMHGSGRTLGAWQDRWPTTGVAWLAPFSVNFRVERQAMPMPYNRGPAYPEDLRQKGREGTVIAEFVVNSNGEPEPSSLRILQSSDPQFALAIYRSLPGWRYVPAKFDGRPVSELVQQPFGFNLTHFGLTPFNAPR